MGTIVLDTSVLIALVDGTDVHHEKAREVIDQGRARGDTFVVPVAAYAEFMVGSFHGDPADPDFRDGLMDAIPAVVAPATRLIGRHAAALRARHGRRMPLPDALIVGTALDLKADRVVTADTGWPELEIAVELLRVA
jgi:predicted nucleic acid-binding protein